jgi:hypothetical protein
MQERQGCDKPSSRKDRLQKVKSKVNEGYTRLQKMNETVDK